MKKVIAAAVGHAIGLLVIVAVERRRSTARLDEFNRQACMEISRWEEAYS